MFITTNKGLCALFRNLPYTRKTSRIRGFFLLVTALVMAGCSGAEVYGPGVDRELPTVQVRDILFNNELQESHVTIQGDIVSICPSRGCWFYMQDSTGRIFVDLSKTDITLPYRQGRTVGSTATVSGKVIMRQGQPMMEATGLEVR
ncbi:MAG: hypothetical protein D5R98_04690 [Desulfonatronovibrio sp. MSAO_Bac4]|nr:MAG: hypothetical protein D5R98_04690 [Desulfonatronovibrio sp. MSAO_Bac4]